ncbi:hypothetical protein EUX98_g8508 [Antrodiella citrinella]|uniref:Alcohol dehydrogenase-like C-terminal domain-containing protein n=1 Tax=Antrodiella citrinella TaxID=2447956 RepID=A0A4V3XGC2_9APHY|nr:hypothetical protein EUX98_g8508 [Antrodiella citrinella]
MMWLRSQTHLMQIPPGVSFADATTLPVAFGAAAIGLYGPKIALDGVALTPPWEASGRGKYADQPILILGGSSDVGQATIQLAKVSGFSPIMTTVSSHNNGLVTSLRATHIINRNAPLADLADSINVITLKPITVIFDAVSSPETQIASYKVLADDGSLVIVHYMSVPEAELVKELKFMIGIAPNFKEFGKILYEHLGDLVENGDLKPNKVELVQGGLTGVPDALDRVRKNAVSATKLVVQL